ncbi:MAG: hypothetical protein KAT05_17305, partial [Spirochaetes bacterium]|nr:hypothetical protein [Spirochaetota bacterium]
TLEERRSNLCKTLIFYNTEIASRLCENYFFFIRKAGIQEKIILIFILAFLFSLLVMTNKKFPILLKGYG